METKIQVRDLLDAFDSLQGIGSLDTNSRIALKIAQNLRVLQMEVKTVTAQRQDIIDDFGGVELVPVGNGRSLYVPFPEGWNRDGENSNELVAIQAALSNEFDKVIEDFNSVEIEITLRGLDPSKDLPNGIKGNDVVRCWWLIEGFDTFDFDKLVA